MTITEATRVAGSGDAEEVRKVRIRPGRMRVVGATAVLLLPVAACAPAAGGGGPVGADLSEHAIVYTSSAGDADADLWLVKADGTHPVRLTDKPGLEFMAAWSPDGHRLAYAAGATQDSQSDLFVLDIDGGELRQVTSTADRCESAPSWTPDGEELVYVSRDCEEGAEGIFAIGLDGGEERELVAGSWPDVGPDGRLLYTAPVPGRPWYVQRLWVSEPDGSQPRDVTPRGFDSASEATWSPDGGRIAFVVAAGDPSADKPEDWNEEVYVMDADGSNPHRLTTTPGNDHWPPSWSPDGRRLVYSADGVHGSSEVATVDLETLEVTPLTDDDDHDLLPAWRP
jgi:Tol biopolymer transport system component